MSWTVLGTNSGPAVGLIREVAEQWQKPGVMGMDPDDMASLGRL